MKNKTFSTFIALVLNLCAFSQFYISPEFGTNLLKIRKTDLGKDFHIGWHGGLRVSYELNSYFTLESGAYFTQKSQSFEEKDTSPVEIFGFNLEDLGIPGTDFNKYSSTEGIVSQYYVQVPIVATYSFKGFHISYGPYLAYMVHAWTKQEEFTEVPFMKAFNIEEFDTTGFISAFLPPAESTNFSESSSRENLNCMDWGFKSTVSYRPNNFGIQLSYLLGLPDYRIDRGELEKKRHHYFQLTMSYRFGFHTQSEFNSRM